jgi:YD repeat-containing protein
VRISPWCVLSMCLLFAFTPAFGQVNNDPGLGISPTGVYDGSSFESVSLENGNVALHIPLLTYPQRGKLNFSFSIYFNRPNWYFKVTNTAPRQVQYFWAGGGVQVVRDQSMGVRGTKYNDSYNEVSYCTYGLFGADGASHPILAGYSADGTGYKVSFASTASCSVYGQATVVDREGVTYLLNSSVTDPSGNKITLSSTGWTDSLGRNIPGTNTRSDTQPSPMDQTSFLAAQDLAASDAVFPGVPTSDFSGCPGTPSSARLWTVPAFGGTANYKLCFALIPAKYPPNPGTGVTPFNGSLSLLQAVVLPNQTYWSFTYDSAANLTSIQTPKGGTIQYAWFDWSGGAGGSPYTVSSRTVDWKDGSGPHQWTYQLLRDCPTNSPCTVTDPNLNDTVLAGAPNSGQTKVTYYAGSASANRVLKTVTTQYHTDTGPGQDYTPLTGFEINVLPTSVTTVLDNGQTSQTTTTYDTGTSATLFSYSSNSNYTYPVLYGVTTQRGESDFAQGTPGPLLRQTNTQYVWQSNGNYLNANFLASPSSINVLNGAGQQVASTTYAYDENNGSPQGVLGNLTSTTKWLNGGTSPKTQTVYSTQGMSIKTIDAMGNATQISYDATGMFPNQIQYPTAANGVAHIEKFSYDANIGKITSHTDQNSQPTTFGYDSMRRLTGVTYPTGGGSETYQFNDSSFPRSFTYTRTISATTNLVQVRTVDGLGRPIQTALTSDPDGTTYTARAYDPLGGVSQVYNPTRCSTPTTNCGESTWGVTTNFYDALGRTCLVVPPDGTLPSGNPCASQPSNTVFTSYAGNTTTVTDQASKRRQTTTDGLGRLTQVTEDPGGLGYITTYSYDALDNLTGVVQNGSRQRSFTYDSLSRLVCASNPENSSAPCPATATSAYTAGTTGYTYDANGNLLTKTSPAPNQTGSATVTTTYSYDLLDRLTRKTYSDGTTPSPYYWYDQSTVWNYTVTNSIGRQVFGGIDNIGAIISSFDSMGRVQKQVQCTPLNCGAMNERDYAYDLAGNNTSYKDVNPSNLGAVTYTQTFDTAGRLLQLTSNLSDAQHPATLFSVDPSHG